MKIIVASFGFKFGTPEDADLLIDARSLMNPFQNKGLRARSGLDDDVWVFVAHGRGFESWQDKALIKAKVVVNNGLACGSPHVAIGVGCVGGRHRSVVACMELARALYWIYGRGGNNTIDVAHRDITKGEPVGNLMTAQQLAEEFKKPTKQFNVRR